VRGNAKNLYRHLQLLYHKGLVYRFAFNHGKNPSEFHYYLDSPPALELLVENGVLREALEWDEVRRNREKAYCEVNNPKQAEETPGRLLFVKHELMISRFHAMLELACRGTDGRVKLSGFQQGPRLWGSVEVPRLEFRNGVWREAEVSESIPHRPDAFFSLTFPNQPGREPLHFFYEADRHRTNTYRFNKKLRGHFYFIVKQQQHKTLYGVKRIRAVLTETVDDEWADRLRLASGHATVSGTKPTSLFWFTTSRLFVEAFQQKDGGVGLPAYLQRPEIVLGKIWASPVGDKLYSLTD
jgi:hypothetical protein